MMETDEGNRRMRDRSSLSSAPYICRPSVLLVWLYYFCWFHISAATAESAIQASNSGPTADSSWFLDIDITKVIEDKRSTTAVSTESKDSWFLDLNVLNVSFSVNDTDFANNVTNATTPEPSAEPSDQPIPTPSRGPTRVPTSQPSSQPSMLPTSQPSMQPTSQPTYQTTAVPSSQPSSQPTGGPSLQPIVRPTTMPTCIPSVIPTVQPSSSPTSDPTMSPTAQPSAPSPEPTTSIPTAVPTAQPTPAPTFSSAPTASPTNSGDTLSPTSSPPTPSPTLLFNISEEEAYILIPGETSLDGIPPENFDSDAQNGFKNTLSGSVEGADADDVIITGFEGYTISRRILNGESHPISFRNAMKYHRGLTETGTTVDWQLLYQLNSTSENTTEAYNSVVNDLTAAVSNSSAFVATLASFSSAFENVSGTAISVSSFVEVGATREPTAAPSVLPTPEPSARPTIAVEVYETSDSLQLTLEITGALLAIFMVSITWYICYVKCNLCGGSETIYCKTLNNYCVRNARIAPLPQPGRKYVGDDDEDDEDDSV